MLRPGMHWLEDGMPRAESSCDSAWYAAAAANENHKYAVQLL